MDYTYKEKEIGFARHIRVNPPKKIWWDFFLYVFDYGDNYFQIEWDSVSADTQNSSDEAIIGQFTKHEEPFVPGKDAKLVCENMAIEELYIVRVFLYFSAFREYSGTQKLFMRAKQKVKSLLSGKKDAWEEIMSKAIAGWQEITCHPQSEEAKKVNASDSNLIDCGMLLQINGKMLKAFVESNGVGFHVWDEKYFFEMEELKEIAGKYELIKI